MENQTTESKQNTFKDNIGRALDLKLEQYQHEDKHACYQLCNISKIKPHLGIGPMKINGDKLITLTNTTETTRWGAQTTGHNDTHLEFQY